MPVTADAPRFRQRRGGYRRLVLTAFMHRLGLRGWHLHIASLSSVVLCIVLWIRAKTIDQAERGNAERRALFAGLWAPTLWGMGNGLERRDDSAQVPRARRAARFSRRRRGRRLRLPH